MSVAEYFGDGVKCYVLTLTKDTPMHRLYDLLRKAVNNHSVLPT